jgi:hypothetical protein
MGQDCLKKRQSGSGVVAEELLRVHHGLAGLDEGGKVENAAEGPVLTFRSDEKVFNQRPISQLPFHKIHAWRHEIAPTVTKVVVNDYLMSRIGEESRNCSTYVPGTARNQYLHDFPAPFRAVWFNVSLLQ